MRALESLRAIPAALVRPHVHVGLGLRQLRPGVYPNSSSNYRNGQSVEYGNIDWDLVAAEL